MGRESAAIAILLVAIVAGAVRLSRRLGRFGAPTLGRQVAVGLLCGIFGAVVAAVPYVDLIPDRWEVPLLIVVPATAVITVAIIWWRDHRRPRDRSNPIRTTAAGPGPVDRESPRPRLPSRPVRADKHHASSPQQPGQA